MKKTPLDKEDPMIAAAIAQQAVVDIAAAMKALSNTRLKRNTIVVLIHAKSGVPKRDINRILDNLESIEKDWLKTI